jgi:hypothetical protein
MSTNNNLAKKEMKLQSKIRGQGVPILLVPGGVNVDASLILELYRQGYGYRLISKEITKSGSFISASTVKRILEHNIS